MKIPIDQYDSKLHGRVFGVFLVAVLVVTLIAWFIDGIHGNDWHRQLIEFFDIFWPKAVNEARLLGSAKGIPPLVGPYLLVHATFTILTIIVSARFIIKMRKAADFSQPGKLMLQPDSLILAPIALGLTFGVTYFADFSDGNAAIGRSILRTPILLFWLALCYAGISITYIRIAAVIFARSEKKSSNISSDQISSNANAPSANFEDRRD